MPSSSSSSGAAKVGRIPESTSASMTLECALRCTTTRSPHMGERQPGGEVALGGAVDEEPDAPRAPGLGGEALRLLEGGGVDADVDSVRERGDVHAQRELADRLDQPRRGARPALVPGHVQARGVAIGVLDERVQIRRALLLGGVGHGAGESTALRAPRSMATASTRSSSMPLAQGRLTLSCSTRPAV